MRIIIIGGTRFIGPEVVRQLLQMGHEVAVFHRGRTDDERAGAARHILGDRKSLTAYRNKFRRFHPDVALDMFPLNGDDAAVLVDTFHGLVPRIVAISSMDVYLGYGRLYNSEPGPIEATPFTEDSPLRRTGKPHGPEHNKIEVERAVMRLPDTAGTILRLPMVYGPGDRQHRLHGYLKRMDDDRPYILLEGTLACWRWTRGYVDNVAAAICLAVVDGRAAGRIYNVGEPHTHSEAEWVLQIARCAGWNGEIVAIPETYLPEKMRSDLNFRQHLEGDCSRIRRELGYLEPVECDEGLMRAVAWERENPPEKIDPGDFDYEAEDRVMEAFRTDRQ